MPSYFGDIYWISRFYWRNRKRSSGFFWSVMSWQIELCENTWKNGNKKWHMKMIDHNHFICHLILGTFTEYPFLHIRKKVYKEIIWVSESLSYIIHCEISHQTRFSRTIPPIRAYTVRVYTFLSVAFLSVTCSSCMSLNWLINMFILILFTTKM